MYDEKAKLIFTQYIGWMWDDVACAWRVDWWRIPGHAAAVQYGACRYYVIIIDKDVWRRIDASQVIHSWTQFDREIENRGLFPPDKRQDLPKEPAEWNHIRN